MSNYKCTSGDEVKWIAYMKMPLLFIGHGSPMNAIAENSFTKTLNDLGKNLPAPKAILCVSAHWMTQGTWATSMSDPKTIHDFYGFPKQLFDVQYKAKGSPDTASLIQSTLIDPKVRLDAHEWGLDHGTWSVLKHMYPNADIPVLQMSLSIQDPPEYHFKVGEQLKFLRDQGVLIVGSGNMVHNLRRIDWKEDAKPFDWAIEADEWMKKKIESRDFKSLIYNAIDSEAGKLSIPTWDHYYPLLYILGASDKKDQLKFEYEGFQNASISMRALSFS